MIAKWVRTWDSALLEPFLRFLARLGITANMLTIASLLIVVMAGILLAFDKMIWGCHLFGVAICLYQNRCNS